MYVMPNIGESHEEYTKRREDTLEAFCQQAIDATGAAISVRAEFVRSVSCHTKDVLKRVMADSKGTCNPAEAMRCIRTLLGKEASDDL